MRNFKVFFIAMIATFSSVAFADFRCDCSGSCGDGFTASAWAQYGSHQQSSNACVQYLNSTCQENGYNFVINSTVRMNCRDLDGNSNPNPIPPAPPAGPDVNPPLPPNVSCIEGQISNGSFCKNGIWVDRSACYLNLLKFACQFVERTNGECHWVQNQGCLPGPN